MRRRLWLGMVMGMTLASGGLLAGCSGEPAGRDKEMGTLSLPLATHGPSGAEYRLRNAVFEITSEYYYYGGEGGAGGNGPNSYTVSSEDDPAAESIRISVEQGYYYVNLLPGWYLEKVVPGPDETVEAQLISGNPQWTYVSPHSSSWVEFQFGIGDRELWFNGDLNIGVVVYEDPSDIYGGGGAGAAGAPGGFGGESASGGSGG